METRVRSIGDKVRQLRKSHGWTQQELADKAGITKQTVWNLESARSAPGTGTLMKLADALGVDLGDLLG